MNNLLLRRYLFLSLFIICFVMFPAGANAEVKKLAANVKSLNLFVDQSYNVEILATNDDRTVDEVTGSCDWSSANEDVVVAESGVITAVGEGKTTVTAEYEGKKVTIQVTVNPAVSKLVFSVSTEAAWTMAKGDTMNVKAYALCEADDGTKKIDVTNQCQWDSSDDNIVSVYNGRITALNSGEATVTASLPIKDGNVYSAEANIKVFAALKEIQVNPGEVILTTDSQPYPLQVLAVYKDGTTQDVTNECTVTVANTKIVSYSTNGIEPLATGDTRINVQFAGKKATVKVSVMDAITKLEITPNGGVLLPGKSIVLRAKIKHSKGSKDVTAVANWSSSDENVIKVKAGKLTAVGSGKAKVTATYLGYSSDPVEFTVSPSFKSLTAYPDTSKDPAVLIISRELSVAVTADYGSFKEDVTDKVSWYSSNSKVATIVEGTNKIKAWAKGTATITGNVFGKTVKFNVIVYPEITKLEYEPVPDLEIGQVFKLKIKATIKNPNGSETSNVDVTNECTYKSDKENIVQVDPKTGQLSAKASGDATITVNHPAIDQTLKITIPIKVKNAINKMYFADQGIEKTSVEVQPNGTKTLKFMVKRDDGSTEQIKYNNLQLSIGNKVVATYGEENGDIIITGRNIGKTELYATYNGKTIKLDIDCKGTSAP
ncbi:Ig-like domain-containing protein [Desulforamulus putei]|uniref:Ig-like domain-containing protein n=1 Tax=Desulforamulus putei TaxID=74701 RepID=UPI002FDD3B03